MSWPTMSDYQEAVQNPANCFSDPDLKKGTPTLNALGLPQPVTGGFCSVYQITSSKTRWAVRCFLHNIKDIRDRYHQISKYLKSQRLKQMVGFGYVPEGIRVRGAWYPVLRMEWVDGHNLDRWVENHLKDPRALRKLAERWEELMDQLEKAKIGHCDLQHGNVLVDGSGSLKLIDYDGMYVPPLRGRGSHEKGHPAYQHPEREGKDFDEAVDRFSALVIQASLLALAEKPELWKKYNEEDNLIFKRTDFQSPDSAPVFKDLDKMGGSVAALSNALREACKGRVGKSPRLRDLKNGKAGAPAPIPLPVPPPQPARPASAPSSKAATQPVAAGAAAASRPAARPLVSRPAAPPPAAKVIPFPAAASGGKSKHKSRRAKSQRAKSQRAKSQPAKSQPAKSPPAKSPPAKSPPARIPPTGTQPAWMGQTPAPARAKSRAATSRAAGTAAAVAPAAPPAPKAKTRPALAVVPAPQQRAGWTVEWTRPGFATEKQNWKLPVYGKRDAPSIFLGIRVGTHSEKFVERHDEKIEERKFHVDGHRSVVTALAFSPDARLLASGSRDRTVRVWNTQSGREEAAHLEARAGVVALAFVADRTVVAAVLDDRRIGLWNFGLHRQVVHIESPDKSYLNTVAASKDGKLVAAGGKGRSIFMWQTDGGAPAGEFRRTMGSVEGLAFTADAGGIVCGTHKGRLELYERGHDQARWSVRTGLGRIVALAVPPRTTGAVTGGAGGMVAYWDLKDGTEKQRVRPMRGRLTSLAVTPDAALLLVGLTSGNACLFEKANDREVAVLDGHPGAVTAVALSSTGKTASTGARDGSVRYWAAP